MNNVSQFAVLYYVYSWTDLLHPFAKRYLRWSDEDWTQELLDYFPPSLNGSAVLMDWFVLITINGKLCDIDCHFQEMKTISLS